MLAMDWEISEKLPLALQRHHLGIQSQMNADFVPLFRLILHLV